MLLGAVFWVTREDVLCVMFLLLLVGLVEWMFGCSSHAPYPPIMLRLGCIPGCIDSVSVPLDLVLRVRVCGDGGVGGACGAGAAFCVFALRCVCVCVLLFLAWPAGSSWARVLLGSCVFLWRV